MFESDNQVKSFVKKTFTLFFDICVNPQKSHTLQILIELSFLDEKNKVEIKIPLKYKLLYENPRRN